MISIHACRCLVLCERRCRRTWTGGTMMAELRPDVTLIRLADRRKSLAAPRRVLSPGDTTAAQPGEFLFGSARQVGTDEKERDVFGTLSRPDLRDRPLNVVNRDDDDMDEPFVPPRRTNDQLRPMGFYHEKIKELITQCPTKTSAAVEYVSKKMIVEDCARPDWTCYLWLLRGCAATGDAVATFDVFKQMRQRGFVDYREHNYSKAFTLMFKACANCQNKLVALQKITYLRKFLLKKGIEMNPKTRNSMICAYGRHTETLLAFNSADEGLDALFGQPSQDFFCALLYACSNDSEIGLQCAAQVLSKMRSIGVKLNTQALNLFLRVIRQNGLTSNFTKAGNMDTVAAAGKSPATEMKLVQRDCDGHRVPMEAKAPLQSELAADIAVRSLSSPCTDLVTFIRSLVAQSDVILDIKSFSLMLQVVNVKDIEAERDIVTWMNSCQLPSSRPDVTFYNCLLARACERQDSRASKVVLKGIYKAGLRPNIRTFRHLASMCTSAADTESLLKCIGRRDLRPDTATLSRLIANAGRLMTDDKNANESVDIIGMVINHLGKVSTRSLSRQLTCYVDSLQAVLLDQERSNRSSKRVPRTQTDLWHFVKTAIVDKLKFVETNIETDNHAGKIRAGRRSSESISTFSITL